jgi:hypothetical protein
MEFSSLSSRVFELRITLIGLTDPLPPAAVAVFNELLAEARQRTRTNRLAGHQLLGKIPEAEAETSRAELLIWSGQLAIGLHSCP